MHLFILVRRCLLLCKTSALRKPWQARDAVSLPSRGDRTQGRCASAMAGACTESCKNAPKGIRVRENSQEVSVRWVVGMRRQWDEGILSLWSCWTLIWKLALTGPCFLPCPLPQVQFGFLPALPHRLLTRHAPLLSMPLPTLVPLSRLLSPSYHADCLLLILPGPAQINLPLGMFPWLCPQG